MSGASIWAKPEGPGARPEICEAANSSLGLPALMHTVVSCVNVARKK